MKKLTYSKTVNFKNDLIKVKKDLIRNFRAKKADKNYYGYENDKFHGLKDVRNLFDENDDDDDDIYGGIEYLFDESMMKEISFL